MRVGLGALGVHEISEFRKEVNWGSVFSLMRKISTVNNFIPLLNQQR